MPITNTGTDTPFLIKDYWETQQETVDRLEEVMGFKFDVDVCGSPGSKKAPEVIADEHWWRVHAHIDGLTFDWSRLGQRGFLNPPFSSKPQWLARAALMSQSRGMTVVGVVPHAPATAWYREMEQSTSRILSPDKRVAYIHPITGKVMKAPNFETVFPVWEPKKTISYERFSL